MRLFGRNCDGRHAVRAIRVQRLNIITDHQPFGMTVPVEWNEVGLNPTIHVSTQEKYWNAMRRDPFGRPAGKHSLGVSAHRYRVPVALMAVESAHQELAMRDGQLDGAERRFERLVDQGIEFLPVGVFNPFQS
jgi:hypothetical protein